MNRKYSPEMREWALRMLAETRPSHPTMMSAVRHVAGLLGISPRNSRRLVRQRDGRGGEQPLQDRADPSARLMADSRAGRARDPRMGVVVEQLTGALAAHGLRIRGRFFYPSAWCYAPPETAV